MLAAVKTCLTVLVLSVSLTVAAFVLYPIATAGVLQMAIKSGDADIMNALIDWSSVKSSLRTSILQRLDEKERSVSEGASGLEKVAFEVLRGLSPLMVDHMIAERVSPDGFTKYLGPHSPEESEALAAGRPIPSANMLERVRKAEFVDWSHFQLEVVDRWDPGKIYRVSMVLHEAIWKLDGVEMLALGNDG
jgi:hypothetical protein